MTAILAATSADAWSGLERQGNAVPLEPGKWDQDRPGLHLIVEDGNGNLDARCSLWWNDTPSFKGYRVGLIGHYAAASDAAAAALLNEARARLAAEGCDYAVGPMDGSTWKSYRFVTDSSDEPPFLFEPANPSEYPDQWRRNGFSVIAEYSSALSNAGSVGDPRIANKREQLEHLGIVFRPIDLERVEPELRAIYRASLTIFSGNPFYTPLPEADFLAAYLPVLPMVQPETIVLAECDGELAGYIFGIPDFLQAQRGEPVDTLIVKTLARLPIPKFAGLGSVLLEECETAGSRMFGYRRVIHALMHADNASTAISNHYATTIRKYALFGSALTS